MIPLPLPSMRSAATRSPAEIDDGDGVALLLGARMRRATGDDGLRRACIERLQRTAGDGRIPVSDERDGRVPLVAVRWQLARPFDDGVA